MLACGSRGFYLRKGPFKAITAIITLWSFLFITIAPDFAWAVKTEVLPAAASRPSPIENFTLPAYLGYVRDSYKSENRDQRTENREKTVVIHIQDAHCNYNAQKTVYSIIDYLNRTYGVNTINLEGGEGDYNFSPFYKIEDASLREKTADYFLREGEINGAESFAINNPGKVALWGVEDTDLYLDNLNVYRSSLKDKDDIDNTLKTLSRSLADLKVKLYSKELLEIDRKINDFKSKTIELKDYIAYLMRASKDRGVDISDLANINILNKTLLLEGGVDFKKANIERDQLIDRLNKALSKNEVKELVQKAVEFKIGHIPSVEFYTYLTAKAKEVNINLAEYQNLSLYIGYVNLYANLKKEEIFKEIEALEDRIKDRLYQNDEQRELNKLSKHLAIIKNLLNVTLTQDEFKYYQAHKGEFDVGNFVRFIQHFRDSPSNSILGQSPRYYAQNTSPGTVPTAIPAAIAHMERFYALSFRRDEEFVKRLKAPQAAILITGGFHTENLTKRLKAKNISYISIMPNFGLDDKECPYFKLLAGNNSALLKFIMANSSAIALYSYFSENAYKMYGGGRVDWWGYYVRVQALLLDGKDATAGNITFTFTQRYDAKELKGVRIDDRPIYVISTGKSPGLAMRQAASGHTEKEEIQINNLDGMIATLKNVLAERDLTQEKDRIQEMTEELDHIFLQISIEKSPFLADGVRAKMDTFIMLVMDCLGKLSKDIDARYKNDQTAILRFIQQEDSALNQILNMLVMIANSIKSGKVSAKTLDAEKMRTKAKDIITSFPMESWEAVHRISSTFKILFASVYSEQESQKIIVGGMGLNRDRNYFERLMTITDCAVRLKEYAKTHPDAAYEEFIRQIPELKGLGAKARARFEIGIMNYVKDRDRVKAVMKWMEEKRLPLQDSEGKKFVKLTEDARYRSYAKELIGFEPKEMLVIFANDAIHIKLDKYSFGRLCFRYENPTIAAPDGRDFYQSLSDAQRASYEDRKGIFPTIWDRPWGGGIDVSGLITFEAGVESGTSKTDVSTHEGYHSFFTRFAMDEAFGPAPVTARQLVESSLNLNWIQYEKFKQPLEYWQGLLSDQVEAKMKAGDYTFDEYVDAKKNVEAELVNIAKELFKKLSEDGSFFGAKDKLIMELEEFLLPYFQTELVSLTADGGIKDIDIPTWVSNLITQLSGGVLEGIHHPTVREEIRKKLKERFIKRLTPIFAEIKNIGVLLDGRISNANEWMATFLLTMPIRDMRRLKYFEKLLREEAMQRGHIKDALLSFGDISEEQASAMAMRIAGRQYLYRWIREGFLKKGRRDNYALTQKGKAALGRANKMFDILRKMGANVEFCADIASCLASNDEYLKKWKDGMGLVNYNYYFGSLSFVKKVGRVKIALAEKLSDALRKYMEPEEAFGFAVALSAYPELLAGWVEAGWLSKDNNGNYQLTDNGRQELNKGKWGTSDLSEDVETSIITIVNFHRTIILRSAIKEGLLARHRVTTSGKEGGWLKVAEPEKKEKAISRRGSAMPPISASVISQPTKLPSGIVPGKPSPASSTFSGIRSVMQALFLAALFQFSMLAWPLLPGTFKKRNDTPAKESNNYHGLETAIRRISIPGLLLRAAVQAGREFANRQARRSGSGTAPLRETTSGTPQPAAAPRAAQAGEAVDVEERIRQAEKKLKGLNPDDINGRIENFKKKPVEIADEVLKRDVSAANRAKVPINKSHGLSDEPLVNVKDEGLAWYDVDPTNQDGFLLRRSRALYLKFVDGALRKGGRYYLRVTDGLRTIAEQRKRIAQFVERNLAKNLKNMNLGIDEEKIKGIAKAAVPLEELVRRQMKQELNDVKKSQTDAKKVKEERDRIVLAYIRNRGLLQEQGTVENAVVSIIVDAFTQLSDPEPTAPHISGGPFDVEIMDGSTGKPIVTKAVHITGAEQKPVDLLYRKDGFVELEADLVRLKGELNTQTTRGPPDEFSKYIVDKLEEITANRRLYYYLFTLDMDNGGLLPPGVRFYPHPREHWHIGTGDPTTAIFWGPEAFYDIDAALEINVLIELENLRNAAAAKKVVDEINRTVQDEDVDPAAKEDAGKKAPKIAEQLNLPKEIPVSKIAAFIAKYETYQRVKDTRESMSGTTQGAADKLSPRAAADGEAGPTESDLRNHLKDVRDIITSDEMIKAIDREILKVKPVWDITKDPAQPISRPLRDRLLVLFKGVAEIAKQAAGHDFELAVYPCSGSDITAIAQYADHIITIGKDDLFAMDKSTPEARGALFDRLKEALRFKLSDGMHSAVVTRDFTDYAMELTLLGANPESFKILSDEQIEGDRVVTVTLEAGGRKITHTHFNSYIDGNFSNSAAGHRLRSLMEGKKTVVLSKARAEDAFGPIASLEPIYSLLPYGAIVVSDSNEPETIPGRDATLEDLKQGNRQIGIALNALQGGGLADDDKEKLKYYDGTPREILGYGYKFNLTELGIFRFSAGKSRTTQAAAESHMSAAREIIPNIPKPTPAELNAIERLLKAWFDQKPPPDINEIYHRQRIAIGPILGSVETPIMTELFPRAEFYQTKNYDMSSSLAKFNNQYCSDKESARQALMRLLNIYKKYTSLMEEVNKRIRKKFGREDIKFANIVFLMEGQNQALRNVVPIEPAAMKLGVNIEYMFNEKDDVFGIGDVAHEAGHGLARFIINKDLAGTQWPEEGVELAANWAAAKILSKEEVELFLDKQIKARLKMRGNIYSPSAAQLLAFTTQELGESAKAAQMLKGYVSNAPVERYREFYKRLDWVASLRPDDAGSVSASGTTQDAADKLSPRATQAGPKNAAQPIATPGISALSSAEAAIKYAAGIKAAIIEGNKILLNGTRSPEAKRFIFMPVLADKSCPPEVLKAKLQKVWKGYRSALEREEFSDITVVFYNGGIDDLEAKRKSLGLTKDSALIYIDNNMAEANPAAIESLKSDATIVKEVTPEDGVYYSVGGHVMLALGILDYVRNGRRDDEYIDQLAQLASAVSGGLTKPDEFKDMLKKGDIKISLPPIAKIAIDDYMAAYFTQEEAVMKAL